MVHSLHLYTFATWRIAPPTAPFGSIIDLRRYINYVVIRVFSSQNLRRADSWGTSSTILIGGPIVVAQSKPWFRRHTGRAICKLCAPVHSIMEQTCEDGGGCSGRRSNAKPAAASPRGWPCSSSCPEELSVGRTAGGSNTRQVRAWSGWLPASVCRSGSDRRGGWHSHNEQANQQKLRITRSRSSDDVTGGGTRRAILRNRLIYGPRQSRTRKNGQNNSKRGRDWRALLTINQQANAMKPTPRRSLP
jgi:hypothetical protein